jgi:hypothetical protein
MVKKKQVKEDGLSSNVILVRFLILFQHHQTNTRRKSGERKEAFFFSSCSFLCGKNSLANFGCVKLFGVLSHILHGHIFNKERFPGMIRTSYGE